MGVLKNLTGLYFGRLKVIERAPNYIQPNGKQVTMWKCECSCSKHTIINVESRRLTSGKVDSCGCKKEEEKALRLFETNKNNDGCLMKIIEYNNSTDMVVEFQDKYKAKIHTRYTLFKKGAIRNPYHTSVYNIGIIGNKYPIRIDGKIIKEYQTWHDMLQRCFTKTYHTYEDVTCCDEWLLYENFYEWLHSQDNFNKWLNGNRWALDKDILVKGNKIYSPDTCCLVPQNINVLFVKRDKSRGGLPIGVSLPKGRNKYLAHSNCGNCGKPIYLGYYDTINAAFLAYKKHKESIIQHVAEEEYSNSNITNKCYNAMMNYEVKITD